MAKKKSVADLVIVTDSRGVAHQFRPLEIFCVAKKNFVLLESLKGAKRQAMILKFALGRDGLPKAFAAPNEKEFLSAVKALGCNCDCGCSEHDCCSPAPKSAKKPAAKAKRKAAPKKKAKARR